MSSSRARSSPALRRSRRSKGEAESFPLQDKRTRTAVLPRSFLLAEIGGGGERKTERPKIGTTQSLFLNSSVYLPPSVSPIYLKHSLSPSKPKLDTCGIENGTKSENRFTLDFRPSRTRPNRLQLVPIRSQNRHSA